MFIVCYVVYACCDMLLTLRCSSGTILGGTTATLQAAVATQAQTLRRHATRRRTSITTPRLRAPLPPVQSDLPP